MLHPRVAGVWLTDIVRGFGDLSYTEDWLRGCMSAQWSVPARTRHHVLKAGAPVTIYEASLPVWSGVLSQPGEDGTIDAYGLHTRAAGVLAVDGVGAPTNVPQTAVDAAIARGAVPWVRKRAMSTTPIGEASTTLTLTQLLDTYSELEAPNWRVNHYGEVEVLSAPTSPKWSVVLTEDPFSVSDDDYVTHLNVEYRSGAGSFSRFQFSTSDSTVAAARWGRQEAALNLVSLGIITLADAQRHAAAQLGETGPRLALTNSVTLTRGQLRTIGDSPSGWSAVHAGQMVRLFGVADKSKAAWSAYTDMTIGSLERSEETLVLKPQGQPPSNVREAIAAMSASEKG